MPSVPSCLVLDVRLPGPSGFELHAELTKALSNTFAGIAPAGVTAFIAAQMIGMLASVMLTASARSPDWVKSGKAQPEQMFSASRTTGDIKNQHCGLAGEGRDHGLSDRAVDERNGVGRQLHRHDVVDAAEVTFDHGGTSALPPTAARHRTSRYPLGASTYQVLSEGGATPVTTAPVGGIGANAQTVTPNATSGAGGAGGGVSSSANCLGAIPSTAGNAGAGNLFGGNGGC